MSIVKLLTITCTALAAATLTVAAPAAELKIFSTIAVQAALEELTPQIEAATGDKPRFTWGTADVLVKRVQAGETADLLVLTRKGFDTLVGSGKVVAGPQADLVSSDIAVVVKKGAPRPDISTPSALKQTLLKAGSIAFSNPAAGGASGVYIAKLLVRMGIAKQLESKIKYPPPSGNAALLVADGEAELAIQQHSEVMSIAGTDVVGPLPAAINDVTTFAAGVGAASHQAKAALQVIKFLHTPEATAVFKAKGLMPVAASTAPH